MIRFIFFGLVPQKKKLKGNLSKYEFGRLTYTYQTLEYFQEENKDDEIYFICGSDNLEYIDDLLKKLENVVEFCQNNLLSYKYGKKISIFFDTLRQKVIFNLLG